MIIWDIIISVISGYLGSIGIGGGSVLVIYLSLIRSFPQLKAQGINLLFFLPCAVVGLIFHFKNKLINVKAALPLIFFGIVGVIIGFLINKYISEEILRKIFGSFVILIAVSGIINDIKSKKIKLLKK